MPIPHYTQAQALEYIDQLAALSEAMNRLNDALPKAQQLHLELFSRGESIPQPKFDKKLGAHAPRVKMLSAMGAWSTYQETLLECAHRVLTELFPKVDNKEEILGAIKLLTDFCKKHGLREGAHHRGKDNKGKYTRLMQRIEKLQMQASGTSSFTTPADRFKAWQDKQGGSGVYEAPAFPPDVREALIAQMQETQESAPEIRGVKPREDKPRQRLLFGDDSSPGRN